MIMCMYSEKNGKVICITNRKLVHGDFLEQIRQVAKEPVDAIILREKDLSEEAYEALAGQVLEICRQEKSCCIFHNFPQAARNLGCQRLHLPMDGLRSLSKEERDWFRLLGASVHSVEEAREAEKLGADYVTASHIFPTACKEGLAPRGLSFLQEVKQAVTIPVYALGGIHREQIALCRSAGADGVCMMSEFMTRS